MVSNQRPDYRLCYKILHLERGVSWEHARRNYKEMAQRWHPDRHQSDERSRVDAERRLRQINYAIRAIAAYQKSHSRMPLDRPRTEPPQPRVKRAGPEAPAAPEPVQSDWGGWRWSFLLLPIGLWVVTILMWPDSTQQQGEVEPTPARRAPAARMLGAPKLTEFRFGDTRDRVLSVQGQPTSRDKDSWYFGKSRVDFEQGRVVGWYDHLDSPLRAAGLPPGSRPLLIRYGSSRAEVLRIQGEPLLTTDRRWDYGPSYIEFHDGKVIGWHSSILQPLRVDE